MFIGRDRELSVFQKLYDSERFEFLILYGQRRIGKTTLINQFCAGKKTLFFTAKQMNDPLNLQEFTKVIFQGLGLTYPAGFSFPSWKDAFLSIKEQIQDEKLILVIDEYPYAALGNKSLNSILQEVIDHHYLDTNIKLILSGSHVAFMEKEVMAYKSPLYGRKTSQIQLKAFDYYDAAKFLPSYSNVDKLKFYSILGGVPYYLSMVAPQLSFEENLIELFFRSDSQLYQEPDYLIREEYEQPQQYISILQALGSGATKMTEIADKAKIQRSSLTYYLDSLLAIRFIKKVYPFGEDRNRSRKGQYELADQAFQFYYAFVFPHESEIERDFGETIAKTTVLPALDHYIGQKIYESVCSDYLVRCAQTGVIKIIPHEIARWWGNDPYHKRQADIDIVFASHQEALLAECKWRNEFNEMATIDQLLDKPRFIPGFTNYSFYLFGKKKFGDQTISYAQEKNVHLISVDDLFAI